MKRLLVVTVLSLLASAVFAEDKPAKPQANTKATPKAGAKAKPAAKKTNAFEAYEAGPWKPVDNKKGHLYGYQISDGDLKNQPVLIVVFDPDVEVSQDDRESDPKYIYQFLGWEVKVQPHLQVVNVPSRELTKDEIPMLKKMAGKTAAVPGFPWYQNVGLEKMPENPDKAYPFYYVVDTAGKVIYAGTKGKQAQSMVYGALKKSGEPDPMLGFVKPEAHAEICKGLEFGVDTTKVVAKLKPLTLKGTDESKAEAQAILDALDQTKTYQVKTLLSLSVSEPQMAVILAKKLVKTFPRDKQKFLPAVEALKNTPAVKNTLQLFEKLLAYQEKMPEKKADVQKAYQDVLKGERMCNKARKEFGDKMPKAFMTMENMVQIMKSELESRGASAK